MDHMDEANSPLGSTSTNSRSCTDLPGLSSGEKPWSPERDFPQSEAPAKLFVSFLTFRTTIYELNQPQNIWIKLFP